MDWGDVARELRRRWIELAPVSFARCCAPDDEELGRLGEALAARHLRARGWTIEAVRARTAFVEVDLVARDGGGTRVLVEVKSGRTEPVPRPRGGAAPPARWRPGQRFDVRRAERLGRLARTLARRSREPVRVDLVEVFLDLHTRRARVELHRGAELSPP